VLAYERGYSAGYQRAKYHLFVKPMSNYRTEWDHGKENANTRGNADGS